MSDRYTSRMLDVNLSTKQVVERDLGAEVMQKFLGGQGLAIKTLYEEVGPNVEPLSPNNIVVISAGLLNGTSAPTSHRTELMTKSPLTGNIGRGNFGGSWGYWLKRAGYEAVVIRGRSDSPVYLLIDNDNIQLKDAGHLWGKDTWDTQDSLKEEFGDGVGVLSIGQAGENLVKFACPVCDYYHAPGRSHAGCVMGAKKLKAIVAKGTREVAVAEPEKFEEAAREAMARIKGHPDWGNEETMRIGSVSVIKRLAEAGMISCKNFQTTAVSPDSDLLHAPESVEEYLIDGLEFCYRCHVGRAKGCNVTADIKTGKYAGLRIGAISFLNTQWIPQCGLKSYPASWRCKELCQRYGMDQTMPIPFAMELFEKGVITREDTAGLELNWGNEDAIFEMLRQVAYRENFGDVLADGSVSAAKKIGRNADKFLVVLKGMEILGYEPRVSAKGTSLGMIVCPRGGDDLNTTHAIIETVPPWVQQKGLSKDDYLQWWVNWLDMPENLKEEVFGAPPRPSSLDSDTTEGKAAMVRWYALNDCIFNSLGLCMLPVNSWGALGATHFAKLYSAYSGWQTTPQEMQKAGERIFNLIKAYSAREGFNRKDDDWPERLYEEKVLEGTSKGASLSRDTTGKLLDEFYELMGWDKHSGIPSENKLVELGLSRVAVELWGDAE